MGFRGVVISDSLQAGAVRHVRGAAVKAARAGVDLLVYPTSERGVGRGVPRAAGGRALAPVMAARLTESARRIRALKTR